MKVLAIGATNSTTSINQQLAAYTAGLVEGAQVEVLDLNDFEMPIYSEKESKTRAFINTLNASLTKSENQTQS